MVGQGGEGGLRGSVRKRSALPQHCERSLAQNQASPLRHGRRICLQRALRPGLWREEPTGTHIQSDANAPRLEELTLNLGTQQLVHESAVGEAEPVRGYNGYTNGWGRKRGFVSLAARVVEAWIGEVRDDACSRLLVQ